MAQGIEDQDHCQRDPAPEVFQSPRRRRGRFRKHGRLRQDGLHPFPGERDPPSPGVQQKESRQADGGDAEHIDQVEGLNSVWVTGSRRSTTGWPATGSRSGFPGVAMMRGAEADSPQCHTVPIPR